MVHSTAILRTKLLMYEHLEDKLHPNHISISFQALIFEFSFCTQASLHFFLVCLFFSFLVPLFYDPPPIWLLNFIRRYFISSLNLGFSLLFQFQYQEGTSLFSDNVIHVYAEILVIFTLHYLLSSASFSSAVICLPQPYLFRVFIMKA